MRLFELSPPADLTPSSLDWAVRVFVDEFGHWPKAVVYSSYCATTDLVPQDPLHQHIKSLGLSFYALPEVISLKENAWGVCDGDGNTIWSPGV